MDALSAEPPVGLSIRPLAMMSAIEEAAEVFDTVWQGDRGTIPPQLMRALAYAGNYVVGLYDVERMIGASVAFFAAPAERSMHSHATGVLAEYRSQGLGRVLKQHQREWALARGVGHITWTFDPLIARNAHFNLRVLGASVTDYLVEHYGSMPDGVNRGTPSDRLMATWALASPPAREPEPDRVVATVALPSDIEAMRHEDPSAAAAWRLRVREEFRARLDEGLVVAGFDDERGYLFVRP